MRLRHDRWCFERPYPTNVARNRDHERVLLSVALCESADQLTRLQEEYAYELEAFRAFEARGDCWGFEFHSIIMDAIALRGSQVRFQLERPYETDQ